MTRGGRLLSVRGSANIRGLTAGDGPFLYGICAKNISLSELQAFLDQDGPVSPDETDKSEIATRGSDIRTIGIIKPEAAGLTASLYMDNRSMSGLVFTEESAGWRYWIKNLGAAMTPGATLINTVQFFVEFNPSG